MIVIYDERGIGVDAHHFDDHRQGIAVSKGIARLDASLELERAFQGARRGNQVGWYRREIGRPKFVGVKAKLPHFMGWNG